MPELNARKKFSNSHGDRPGPASDLFRTGSAEDDAVNAIRTRIMNEQVLKRCESQGSDPQGFMRTMSMPSHIMKKVLNDIDY